MLMKIAEAEPERIPQILADIEKYVTRKADISRLEGFKKYLATNVPEEVNNTLSGQNRTLTDDINF